MYKYDALQQHLSRLPRDEWSATFAQIEQILGFELPASARKYPAWWANQKGAGHSQSQAWQGVGWQTCELDLVRRQVRFLRTGAQARSHGTFESPQRGADRHLLEEARRFSGIEREEDLVREGYKALIEREAARKLAQLGGTMPGFSPAPRRPE